VETHRWVAAGRRWGMTRWRLGRFLSSVVRAGRLMQKKSAFKMPIRPY